MGYKVTIEVPVILVFVSFMLTASVYTNLIIYRTCYITLGYNETECALLGTSGDNEEREKLEKLVEPTAAVINTIRGTIESIFTSTLCLFIGPWTDRFGRKPTLLLSLIGFTLVYVLNMVFSFMKNLSPWYSFFCSIPLILTGGGATYLSVTLSYLTDITSEEKRGISMAVFEACVALGILIGNFGSAYLLYATNYQSVFAVACGCCILGIFYTYFFIPESLENVETEGKFKALFQTSNIVEMFKSIGKSRENYNRAIILMGTSLLVVYIFIINGDGAVSFLFLRSKFNWSLTQYQLYSSASNIVWIVGTVIGTYLLHKVLNVAESVLTLMGVLCMFNGMLIQGLATTDFHIYLAAAVRLLGGLISPMVRTMVSKISSPEEVGKIFSAIIAAEFFVSLGAGPLYTLVYNDTINKDPGIFNFLSAGLYGVDIIIVLIIMFLQFRSPPVYTHFQNEEETVINDGPSYAIN